jgi:hypothetical protein
MIILFYSFMFFYCMVFSEFLADCLGCFEVDFWGLVGLGSFGFWMVLELFC